MNAVAMPTGAGTALDGASWPPRPGQRASFLQCVLLAALLHLWLIVIVGNTQGGTAPPGQGVWGAINVTLRGSPVGASSTGADASSGPVGTAREARIGGVVRDESRAPRENDGPGAARLGQWRAVPSPDAREITPGEAPQVPAPVRGDPAAEPRMLRGAQAPLTAPAAQPQRVPSAAAVEPPAEAARAAPADQPAAPERPSTAAPSQARRMAPELTPARPSTTPLAALSPLPSRVQPQDALPTTVPLPPRVSETLRPTPELPDLPSWPAEVAAEGRLAAAPDGLARPTVRRGPLAPLPATSPVTLPPALAPTPDTVISELVPPERRLPTAPVAPAAALQPPLPAPLAVPPVTAPSLLETPSVPDAALVPPAAERVLPPLAAGPTLDRTAPTPPLQGLAPPTTPAGTPVDAGFAQALRPVPVVAAGTPSLPSTRGPEGAASPQPPAGSGEAAPGPAVGTLPGSPRGAPDAGPIVGRDIATPPSRSASAPLLLELPRGRGGEIARDAPRSVLNLMPPPPERKSKLATDIEQSARKDCRSAYAGMGILAPLAAAADVARDRACKW